MLALGAHLQALHEEGDWVLRHLLHQFLHDPIKLLVHVVLGQVRFDLRQQLRARLRRRHWLRGCSCVLLKIGRLPRRSR